MRTGAKCALRPLSVSCRAGCLSRGIPPAVHSLQAARLMRCYTLSVAMSWMSNLARWMGPDREEQQRVRWAAEGCSPCSDLECRGQLPARRSPVPVSVFSSRGVLLPLAEPSSSGFSGSRAGARCDQGQLLLKKQS